MKKGKNRKRPTRSTARSCRLHQRPHWRRRPSCPRKLPATLKFRSERYKCVKKRPCSRNGRKMVFLNLFVYSTNLCGKGRAMNCVGHEQVRSKSNFHLHFVFLQIPPTCTCFKSTEFKKKSSVDLWKRPGLGLTEIFDTAQNICQDFLYIEHRLLYQTRGRKVLP